MATKPIPQPFDDTCACGHAMAFHVGRGGKRRECVHTTNAVLCACTAYQPARKEAHT